MGSTFRDRLSVSLDGAQVVLVLEVLRDRLLVPGHLGHDIHPLFDNAGGVLVSDGLRRNGCKSRHNEN